jgi:hypothetical protein
MRESDLELQRLADEVKKLTARVEDMQKVLDEMKPNIWVVTWAKAIVGIFAVLLVTSFAGFFYTAGSRSAQIDAHEKAIDKLDKANADLTKLILERFPKTGYGGALPIMGKVIKATAETLVIESEPDKKEHSFKLSGDTEILIGGRKAKAGDLKPGMHVRVAPDEMGGAWRVEEFKPPSETEPPPPKDKDK